MVRLLWLLPLAAILLLPGGRVSSSEDTLQVTWFPRVAMQGDVCLVTVSGPQSWESVRGEFLGQEFPMASARGKGTFQGLLGIDMNASPGVHRLVVIARGTDQGIIEKVSQVRVEKANFGTQRLTLPRALVELDEKTLERVMKENIRMRALLKNYRGERLWNGAFIRPVAGEVTTAFGLRRILNDQPRSPHTGVDLRAPEGTPVRACNSGVAVLFDELFFSGKSVVLDHGWGVYSMYFHLSKALVQEGDSVTKGEIIGLAGSTGRATGPHLHWGIRLNGARVDPLSIIELTEHLEE